MRTNRRDGVKRRYVNCTVEEALWSERERAARRRAQQYGLITPSFSEVVEAALRAIRDGSCLVASYYVSPVERREVDLREIYLSSQARQLWMAKHLPHPKRDHATTALIAAELADYVTGAHGRSNTQPRNALFNALLHACAACAPIYVRSPGCDSRIN